MRVLWKKRAFEQDRSIDTAPEFESQPTRFPDGPERVALRSFAFGSDGHPSRLINRP